MCTYNGAAFLQEQLESLASQARPPDEVIICDDASEDMTRELVCSWADTVPFDVRFEMNGERLGIVGNFEKAISLCTGDIVALCDQDDVWLDDKLEGIERAFNDQPSLGLWFSDAKLIDERQQTLPDMLWQRFGLDEHIQKQLTGPYRLARLLRRSVVTGATMAFAAKYKIPILPIPQDCPGYIHDRWIATLIAALAPIACSSRPGIFYRQHGGQALGAAQRRSPLEILGSRLRRRPDLIADDLKAVRLIQSRLIDRVPEQITPEARTTLAERTRLLEMRLNRPRSHLRRASVVIRSLISGEYRRHAEGLTSAAKDLLL
jgi:glycosyltransferase involved in cell wall biosynthesis